MKIKKYNELRTSKAEEIKNSVDQAKVIEIQHYNEPVFYLVSKAEYKKSNRDKFSELYGVVDVAGSLVSLNENGEIEVKHIKPEEMLKRAEKLKENS